VKFKDLEYPDRFKLDNKTYLVICPVMASCCKVRYNARDEETNGLLLIPEDQEVEKL
jgi:hypothetical protein